MVHMRKSFGSAIEDGYKNNNNAVYEIEYPSDEFLFNLIKIKTFENPMNMDIFIVFQNEKELLEEGQRKNFKDTVNIGPEYKFIFDNLRYYTDLSKQRIYQILKSEMFVEGGTSTHTCTLVLPVNYINIP